jgi:hypothetical protein
MKMSPELLGPASSGKDHAEPLKKWVSRRTRPDCLRPMKVTGEATAGGSGSLVLVGPSRPEGLRYAIEVPWTFAEVD